MKPAAAACPSPGTPAFIRAERATACFFSFIRTSGVLWMKNAPFLPLFVDTRSLFVCVCGSVVAPWVSDR